MKIKVISFNIRCCDDENCHSIPERAPRLFSILEREDADVIGFQECQLPWEPLIKDALSDKYDSYLVHRAEANPESTPIYWKRERFSCEDKGVFWLSDTPDVESRGWDERFNCYRICNWAILCDKKEGVRFLYMNTHFGFGDRGQCDSSRLISDRARSIASLPTVLTGDFNLKPDSPAYAVLTELFTDVNAVTLRDFTNTFHGYTSDKNLDSHIDYVFVRDGATPLDYRVLRDTFDGKYPSDHYGIVSELEIK